MNANDQSDSYSDACCLVTAISHDLSLHVGRMSSPSGRNVFLCCCQFIVSVDDIPRLSVSHI